MNAVVHIVVHSPEFQDAELPLALTNGFCSEEWATLDRETRSLTRALKRVELPAEMALGVDKLERWQRSARELLEMLLATAPQPASVSRRQERRFSAGTVAYQQTRIVDGAGPAGGPAAHQRLRK